MKNARWSAAEARKPSDEGGTRAPGSLRGGGKVGWEKEDKIERQREKHGGTRMRR